MFVATVSVFFIISSLCYYRVFVTWIFWRLSNLYFIALNLEFNLITQKHGVFVIIFWLIEWLIKLLILLCYSSIIYIRKFTILSFCHISSLVQIYMIFIDFSFCPLIISCFYFYCYSDIIFQYFLNADQYTIYHLYF